MSVGVTTLCQVNDIRLIPQNCTLIYTFVLVYVYTPNVCDKNEFYLSIYDPTDWD